MTSPRKALRVPISQGETERLAQGVSGRLPVSHLFAPTRHLSVCKAWCFPRCYAEIKKK